MIPVFLNLDTETHEVVVLDEDTGVELARFRPDTILVDFPDYLEDRDN